VADGMDDRNGVIVAYAMWKIRGSIQVIKEEEMKYNWTIRQERAIRKQIAEVYEPLLRGEKPLITCIFCWSITDCRKCPDKILQGGCFERGTLSHKAYRARQDYSDGIITREKRDKVLRMRVEELEGWLK